MNQSELNIDDEASYVLGMMELYENDEEIEKMLRLKHLPDSQIQRILALVRREGYLKRINQAKRLMLIGYGVLLLFILIGVYIYLNPEKFSGYLTETDQMGRRASRFLSTPLYWGFAYGIGQSVYGTTRYFSYKRKLSKLVI